MLHGTCRELPGGARRAGAPAARPARSCTLCTSLGQHWWVPVRGKALRRRRKRRRMLGAREPFRSLPRQQDRGKPAAGELCSSAFPASLASVRARGPAERDTWEETGRHLGPSVKAGVCFPGAGSRDPQKAARGLRPVPVGSGWPWQAERARPGSSIPTGASVEALSPSPQPGQSFPRSCCSAGFNPLVRANLVRRG